MAPRPPFKSRKSQRNTLSPGPVMSTPPPSRTYGAACARCSLPDIELSERPVGRATFAAILQEMAEPVTPSQRTPHHTVDYEDAPLDARSVYRILTQPPMCFDSPRAAPEVTVRQTRAGMATMAVIDEELRRDEEAAKHCQLPVEETQVMEVFTFVIVDGPLALDATEEQKVAFVRKRLWHRLPPGCLDAIYRVDLRSADEHSIMMRVWCEVPKVKW